MRFERKKPPSAYAVLYHQIVLLHSRDYFVFMFCSILSFGVPTFMLPSLLLLSSNISLMNFSLFDC